MSSIPAMSSPRLFLVPKALCASGGPAQLTLDEMEIASQRNGPAAVWAAKVLARENARLLDELLGEDSRLPRGVLASVVDTGGAEVVTALVNHRGEVWHPEDGWTASAEPIGQSDTLELDDADVAFIARALREGSSGVVMRAYLPLGFVSAVVPDTKVEYTGKDTLPDGAVVVAVVDPLDKDAVLEMLAVAPGPTAYRRHDGAWYEDKRWVKVLASVKPPTMVKLTDEQIITVTSQVDAATTGQEFQPFADNDRALYMPMRASAYLDELAHEADQRAIDINMALIAVAGREVSPKDMKNTEQLRRYWLYGKGAAKIRWFTPGSWRRCYKNLVKYLGPMTPGYCTNLSKRLGGPGVATHVGSVQAAVEKNWNPDLHPRGMDGQFINVWGLVNLTNMPGFRHGQRGPKSVQGQVIEIIPDPNKPGDPIIRVKMTDPRWDPAEFGETFDARSNQVSKRIESKGDITPDIVPAPAPAPTPAPVPKPVKAIGDTGVIPARVPTPAMTPSPGSPGLPPLEPPPDWDTMGAEARLGWLKAQMEADYAAFRGEPTTFDFTGFDSGIAFNLANTYRDLTNWDPDTARRIDAPILAAAKDPENGLSGGAIAVAHPGTAHPGGIGPKIKQSAMVFKESWFNNMQRWASQKAQDQSKTVPWSMSSKHGDPTVTLIHEFGHQRQFRFLDVAMREVGAAWSPAVRDDGFGTVPDSSNWQETQDIRYAIPKAAPTQYGQSKSSEGFAEAWAARMVGDSSPELNDLLDAWDAYMGISLSLPTERFATTKPYEDLTPAERSSFWAVAGPVLDLPGMRDHYPETAAEYDAWAGQPVAVAAAMSAPIPICYSCVHLGDGMVCTAFPEGIPLAIQYSEADHRVPYPGDNGIQFTQDPTAPAPDIEENGG